MKHLVPLSCALALLACGDDGASLSEMDAAARESPRVLKSGISLSGVIYEFQQPFGGASVAEVEVCEDEPRVCTATDSEGRYTLTGLSPEREVVVTYRKDGFVPALRALVTPRWSSTLGTVQLVPTDYDLSGFNDALRAAGRPELDLSNLGLPSVSFSAVSGANSNIDVGLHVQLDPSSASEPFYFLAPSAEIAVAVASDQNAGWGIFLNVEPREDYELVYEHDDGDCEYVPSSFAGWPSKRGRPNATRVPVREGYTTYATWVFCPVEPLPETD